MCATPLPSSEHTSSAVDPAEWPWTRANLAASLRSDVIRLFVREKGWKSIRSPFCLSLVYSALSRGLEEQIELSVGVWLLCARVQMCVWCLHVCKHLCLFRHIKHDSPTDIEVAFRVVCSGESSHAWGDHTHSGSPLGLDGPCAVVWLQRGYSSVKEALEAS